MMHGAEIAEKRYIGAGWSSSLPEEIVLYFSATECCRSVLHGGKLLYIAVEFVVVFPVCRIFTLAAFIGKRYVTSGVQPFVRLSVRLSVPSFF